MVGIPVNFNNTLQTRKLKYDVLFKQQLPIRNVHLSKPTTSNHQTSYNGYPVKCVFNKDFVDFKSPLENVKVNEAFFPRLGSPDLLNEYMTQDAFYDNVLLPIWEYFDKCFEIYRELSMEGNGIPDYTLWIPLNSEELSNSKKKLLPFVAIEVKPCNAFSDKNTSDLEMKLELVGSKALEKSADLPERDCGKQFLENEKWITTETDGQFNFRKGMKQLKYYLFKMKTEEAFGILTSYCHTYFVILRRDLKTKEDKLIISPVVRFCDKDALKKIAEFILKARTTDRKVIPEESVIISHKKTRAGSYGKEEGETKKRKRGAGGSNEEEKEAETNQCKKSVGDSNNGQQASGVRYIMGDMIGEGRSGCVFQIFDHEGRPFAAKCIVDRCDEDIIHELQNEEEIYKKMKSLQGKVVPQFHFSGYLDGWRHTLVMELLNAEPINRHKLLDEEKAAIFAALEEIHGQGILHGDIKEENILLDRCGTRHAYFIDFAFSTESDCKEAFEKEKKRLRTLLGCVSP